MPELPEVEVTMREIRSELIGKRITKVVVNESDLRNEVPGDLPEKITNKKISSIYRRAKYILIDFGNVHLLFHLGESGSLRLFKLNEPLGTHVHVEFHIEGDRILVLRAPLRKSCYVKYVVGDPYDHPPLAVHGPEPLSDGFTGRYLHEVSQTRNTILVKNFIMEPKVVAGMGNMYASEVLYDAKIHPETEANGISEKRYKSLANSIKKILHAAIENGGTTLEDFPNPFMGPTGATGNYQRKVYGRAGLPCFHCETEISRSDMRSRQTYYCKKCQKI